MRTWPAVQTLEKELRGIFGARLQSLVAYGERFVAGARALSRGEVPGGPGRVSNVVFMGMGEPLANYKAVIGAVRRLTEPTPNGLGMSARGVTVSTVGLVPRINQLAGEGIPVTRYESAPGKAIIYARLKATMSPPAGKAILLMHHMDVVPADRSQWLYPF